VGLTVVSGDLPSVAGAAGPCFDGDMAAGLRATGDAIGADAGAATGAASVGEAGWTTFDGAGSCGAKMDGPGKMGAARGANGTVGRSGPSLGS
jgi:hypothetical protein